MDWLAKNSDTNSILPSAIIFCHIWTLRLASGCLLSSVQWPLKKKPLCGVETLNTQQWRRSHLHFLENIEVFYVFVSWQKGDFFTFTVNRKTALYRVWLGKPEGTRQPGRTGEDNIKIALHQTGWEGVDWCGSWEVQVTGFFEHGHGLLWKVKFSCYRPEQALGDPEGSGFRIFMTFGTMKVVRSSPLRTGCLYPQEFSWYSFLEAESTPEHMVLSVATEEIPSDTTGDRSRDLPTNSALP